MLVSKADSGSILQLCFGLTLSVLSCQVHAGLGSCDDLSGVSETQDVSYFSDIQPIFSNRCVGCHAPPNPSAFLDLTSGYGELVGVDSFEVMGVPRVDPGRFFNSYLFWKINCGDQFFGGRMPFNAVPLNLTDQALIRDWINQLLIFSDGFESQ